MQIRKHLSPKSLFSAVRLKFEKIKDNAKQSGTNKIKLTDSLMSGLAVFNLKFSSLLQFEDQRSSVKIKRNLSSLYRVLNAPSDTHMRRQLDEVNPLAIRPAFNQVFSMLQRGKALLPYQFIHDCYLLSIDGTGQYASDHVHCEECCEKHHKDGRVEYYHQMLGASIVYPGNSIVIPLAPEPITKQDGKIKNDCERNAAKRLLENIRREHPHLKLIVIEDALASNGPHIALLKHLNMHFILGVKPDGNKYLFEWVNAAKCQIYEEKGDNGIIHRFKFFNGAPLNDAQFDIKVNFLEYWEIHPNGETKHFSWITDFELTTGDLNKLNEHSNILYASPMQIMKGGRARWKIENETFNTLKNQGYNFEHNYGHGNKHLCSVFTMLMLLSFLIDQALELCDALYKAARKKEKRKSTLWETMRTFFKIFEWDSWESFLTAIIKQEIPVVNTA